MDTGTIGKQQTLEELSKEVKQFATNLRTSIDVFKSPETERESEPTPLLCAIDQVFENLSQTRNVLKEASDLFTNLAKRIRV